MMPACKALHSRKRDIIEPEQPFDVRVCKRETLGDAQTVESSLQSREADLVLIHVRCLMKIGDLESSGIVLIPRRGTWSPARTHRSSPARTTNRRVDMDQSAIGQSGCSRIY